MQRSILDILSVLKGIARDFVSESSRDRTGGIGGKTKDVLPIR